MADTKISAGADPGTLLATDKAPIARSGSTTAYAATVAELAAYANGAYTPSYFGGSPSMDGTASPGTSALVGRGDHVHPTDTSRYAASNPSGYQTAAQVAAAVAPYANDVGRNLIHNPMFAIAQRGAGPFPGNVYTLDRWIAGNLSSLDTISFVQAALADSDRAQIGDEAVIHSLNNTFTGNAGTGAGNYIDQHIEGVRRLSGKTVTVSFWALASAAGLKLGINIYQIFGTGGSPSSAVQALSTGIAVTLAATWARYTATIALPSTAGKTLGTNGDDATWLRLFYSSGATGNAAAGNIGVQSGIIALWGVQLEVGSVATPLEKIDPRMDLANCQRFYQTSNAGWWGYGPAAGPIGYEIPLPVTMRGVPTVALSGQGYLNASGLGTAALASAITFTATATAAGSAVFQTNYTASADL